MKFTTAILMVCTSLLAGCAGNPDVAYFHKHPHALMREVVVCENNGGALANTARCRTALRLNSRLF